jgi:hypothetical protein
MRGKIGHNIGQEITDPTQALTRSGDVGGGYHKFQKQVTLPRALRTHLGIDTYTFRRFSPDRNGRFGAGRVLYDFEDLSKMSDQALRLPGSKKESRHDLRGDEQSQGAEEIVMVEADTDVWSRGLVERQHGPDPENAEGLGICTIQR